MPGILTGVIIGLARAIGETAPIITIGALTFIAFLPAAPFTGDPPAGLFDWVMSPFTVMPIQMFNWTSRPEAAFQHNAAAAGLVLVRDDAVHERARDLYALPAEKEHQMVGTPRTGDRRRYRGRERRRSQRPEVRDEGAQLLLRWIPGAQEHQHADLREEGDGADRSVGLRQVHLPALLQPHARPLSGQPLRGRDHALPGQHQHAQPGGRSDRGAHAHQHGVPEAESVSQVDLRERRLRPAGARRAQARAARREGGGGAARTRRCGTR